MASAPRRHRFTDDEYHRMGETGILTENVELLTGTVVVREPVGSYHAGTVNRLTRLWTSRLGDRAVVQVQKHTVRRATTVGRGAKPPSEL